MKKNALTLIVLVFLFLSFAMLGCGLSYSSTMQAAAMSGSFGNGGKFAVYNADKDEFIQEYLSEDHLAKKPEEVSAVLRFSENNNETIFILTDAADGTEISQKSVSNHKLKIAYTTTEITRWVLDEWKAYLESNVIREHLATEEALSCQKLAVYYPETDRFTLTTSDRQASGYIPDDYAASKPEEVGLYLSVEKNDNLVSKAGLYDARGNLIAQMPSNTFVSTWLKNLMISYSFDRNFSKQLESMQLGGGKKIVGQDAETGWYVDTNIPQSLLASTPAETALVAVMQQSESDGFKIISIQLVDPVTNETFSETQTYASDSDKLNNWFNSELKAYLTNRKFLLLLEKSSLGGGDKFIVFDEKTGRYSDTFIPADLIATSPKEVALTVMIQRSSHTVSKLYSLFGVYGAGTQTVEIDLEDITVTLFDPLANELFAETTVSAEPPSAVERGVNKTSAKVRASQLEKWFRTQLAAFQYDRNFRLEVKKTPLGGGDKFVAFDLETGRYVDTYLPKDLIAFSPKETALLVNIERKHETKTQRYAISGAYFSGTDVVIDCEIVMIQLLDPVTNKSIATTTVEAELPSSISAGIKELSVTVEASQVEEWLRTQLTKYLSMKR